MSEWVTYRYINTLHDATPNDVLDLLEKAYKNNNIFDTFKGENEFLNNLRILYFDRNKKIIVLYGFSKYFNNRENLKSFIKWISPYTNLSNKGEYHGIVYGSDYSYCPPNLIFGGELMNFYEVQKYHDEEYYQLNLWAKPRVRVSPGRAEELEKLLKYVKRFLKFLENNARKKLRTCPETRELISLVRGLEAEED